MNRIISVTELQRNFLLVFEQVVKDHVPFVITRGNRPEAVLIPYDEYMKFVQADEAGVLKRFEDCLTRMTSVNAKYSEAEVEADLKSATETLRSQKRK